VEFPDLPFLDHNLWDMPTDEKYDWIFSVDVMEHLPEEKVTVTLDRMAGITRIGGYLQIACFMDGCGSLINDTLHLTVKSAVWWRNAVGSRWRIIKDSSDAQYARFAIGEPYARPN
jgi:hypothetical protein